MIFDMPVRVGDLIVTDFSSSTYALNVSYLGLRGRSRDKFNMVYFI